MMYCNPCAEKKHWPKDTLTRSAGPCEVCDVKSVCNDLPFSDLTESVTIDPYGLMRDKMQQWCVAFDVDGTLRNNKDDSMISNEDIRTLLIILSKFKNVWIHIWSGSGELYAMQAGKALGVDHYVDSYSSKSQGAPKRFTRENIIAIDDIQECAMGIANLIVGQK